MKKLIDIDAITVKKLKYIAASEDSSVKLVMEDAIQVYVKNKESERFENLTDEEKEDIGLLMLMQESDRSDKASREEIFNALKHDS
jgi:predicted transcriptional regulator